MNAIFGEQLNLPNCNHISTVFGRFFDNGISGLCTSPVVSILACKSPGNFRGVRFELAHFLVDHE
jgi:hypothetical protein